MPTLIGVHRAVVALFHCCAGVMLHQVKLTLKLFLGVISWLVCRAAIPCVTTSPLEDFCLVQGKFVIQALAHSLYSFPWPSLVNPTRLQHGVAPSSFSRIGLHGEHRLALSGSRLCFYLATSQCFSILGFKGSIF